MFVVKSLNPRNVYLSNSNSQFSRGDSIVKSYQSYVDKISSFNISDNAKQRLLDKLYSMFEKMLSLDAQFIPVSVSGPARYNSSKMSNLSDKILQLSTDISTWFENIQDQIKYSFKAKNSNSLESKSYELNNELEFLNRSINDNILPDVVSCLIKIATLDSFEFIRQFERCNKIYNFRKNTNVYKLYNHLKNGGILKNKEDNYKVEFENDDYKVVIKNDRVFVYFTLKPAVQLRYALKSRGYWWNSNENAWSTYLKRYDPDWIKNLSVQYSKYI